MTINQRIQRLKRVVCQRIFGLDSWFDADYYDKDYAQCAVNRLNLLIEKEPVFDGSIVEIGCGLGDIIGYIDAKGVTKIGYDLDAKVVNTAAFLHPRVSFKCGGFDDVEEDDIFCLILINILHFIDYKYGKRMLYRLTQEKKIEYIMMDELYDTEGSSYKFEYRGTDILGDDYEIIWKSRRIVAAEGAFRRIVLYKKRSRAE